MEATADSNVGCDTAAVSKPTQVMRARNRLSLGYKREGGCHALHG